MTSDINALPTRKTSAGMQIETRPLYIEEWLDKLPYIDFQKTGKVLYEAIRATNRVAVKPPVRLELVSLYNRPYQYYIDSQIRTGAQHTLQTISSMQSQLAILKKIAVNLGLACKLAVDEILRKKTLWGQTKPPLPAMLMSLNYLSHAMIFSFLEYAPIPKNVWREANFIFTFAQDIGQENNTIILPGKDAKTGATSIAHTYKKIALASLADPHHLPFGAIWEIFEQLQLWAEFAQINHFTIPSAPSGYFVVNLDKDAPPLPYSKFNVQLASETHRLIDTTVLGKVIQQQLTALNQGQDLDRTIKISPYFAKSILTHMSKAWGLPPKRYFPRETRKGTMKLACGLNATYFFVNGEVDYSAPQAAATDADDMADLVDDTEMAAPVNYTADEWSLVDEGPGGFAVIKNDKPRDAVRVGELVGISARDAATSAGKWTLGVIRWLMIRQNRIYKIGIQMIGREAQAVAIRATDGDRQDLQYRRALLLANPAGPAEKSVITAKGLYAEARELEINCEDNASRTSAGRLEEATVSFEHFTIS